MYIRSYKYIILFCIKIWIFVDELINSLFKFLVKCLFKLIVKCIYFSSYN